MKSVFGSKKYEFYIILAAVLWGMIGIAVTGLADAGISRMTIVFIRSFTAFASLGIWLLCTDRAALVIRLKDIWCFIGTGALSLTFFNICYFTAMKETSIAVAAVLLYTAPAFVILMSALLFREKITFAKIFSMLTMFAGCLLVSGVFESGGSYTAYGILTGLGAGFGYALYSIFARYAIIRGYSSATVSFYTFLFATVSSLFVSDFEGVADKMNGEIVFYGLFVGVICCTLPYLFYTKGMERTENGRASVLAMAEPLVAAVISVFIDGVPGLWKGVGMAVMFVGVLLSCKQPSRRSVT